MMKVIKNLFHVSLQENDYDAALEFYCGKLGFEQMFELNVGQFKEMVGMGEPDENDSLPWLTYLRIAPEEYLELFNGVINPPDFARCPVPVHENEAFQSFGLGCDNLENAIEELKSKGIEVEDGYITDPAGAKIRLVERKGHKSEKHRLFHSLAGVSIYANDLELMGKHLKGMCFEPVEKRENAMVFTAGESGQYVELLQAEHPVCVCDDDLLGHFALQIYKVVDTVKAWGENDVYCCSQPFTESEPLPVDGTAKGNFGLDRCEIIWMVCPEGNKIEVMVQPGNSMQQEWERKNPY